MHAHLEQQKFIFSQSGGCKSKIKVSAGLRPLSLTCTRWLVLVDVTAVILISLCNNEKYILVRVLQRLRTTKMYIYIEIYFKLTLAVMRAQ